MFGSSSEDDAVVLTTCAMQEKKGTEERRDLEKSGIRPSGQKEKPGNGSHGTKSKDSENSYVRQLENEGAKGATREAKGHPNGANHLHHLSRGGAGKLEILLQLGIASCAIDIG